MLVSNSTRQTITVDAPAEPRPVAPALSTADAAELAARRQADARLEDKLRGWKPLPIWYAFWAVLFGIGAITALAHGQVLVALVAIALVGACAKYVHYLYNGGRRRVWFIIW